MKWLWILILCAGCKKQADAPPGPPASSVPVVPASEVKRGQDACKAYVDKVCACAEAMPARPALTEACSHARALPEAMQVELEVAANAESARHDVLQINDSVRKIVKECIEETAKLPAAGCP
jgi:hypothetical protein